MTRFERCMWPVVVCLMIQVPLHAFWGPDTRLSFGSTNAYTSFNNAWSIAADNDNVIAVWFDSRHGLPNYEIYCRLSSDAGENWGAEIRLTYDDNYSGFPCVAMKDTCIHVAWFDNRFGQEEIFYKHSLDGGATWTADTFLTSNSYEPGFPSVAISDSFVHIAWIDGRDANWEVYYIRSTDYGTTWGPQTRLTNDIAHSSSACIAVHGPYVQLIWADDRLVYAHHDLYYKRSTDYGNSWSADVNLTNTHESYAPCIAYEAPYLYTAWQDNRNGYYDIYFKRSTNNGAFWNPDQRLTIGSPLSKTPSLAASGYQVHMIWCDYESTILGEIFYNRSYTRGATWSGIQRLTYDSLRSWYPTMAVGDSAVHAIWTDDRPGYYNVFYKRDSTGNVDYTQDRVECASNNDIPPKTMIFRGPVILPEGKQCKLYDITGREVKSDLLRPGIYFIKMDEQIIEKVIKVR